MFSEARPYNDFNSDYTFHFHEINFALHAAKNTPNLVGIYQKYGPKMTDMQIMYGFYQIAGSRLERTPEFWNVILPMVKKQLTTLDSQTPEALMMAIKAASFMTL